MLGWRSLSTALLRWDAGRRDLIVLIPRDGQANHASSKPDPFFSSTRQWLEEDGAIVVDLARYPAYDTIGWRCVD